MREPRILDVVRAVTEVAAAHAEVASWWYAPLPKLRVAGELPEEARPARPLEIVVAPRAGEAVDFERLTRELSRALGGRGVVARAHAGDGEERHLFRIVSDATRASSAVSAAARAR